MSNQQIQQDRQVMAEDNAKGSRDTRSGIMLCRWWYAETAVASSTGTVGALPEVTQWVSWPHQLWRPFMLGGFRVLFMSVAEQSLNFYTRQTLWSVSLLQNTDCAVRHNKRSFFKAQSWIWALRLLYGIFLLSTCICWLTINIVTEDLFWFYTIFVYIK